jgi:hypothetical protein
LALLQQKSPRRPFAAFIVDAKLIPIDKPQPGNRNNNNRRKSDIIVQPL